MYADGTREERHNADHIDVHERAHAGGEGDNFGGHRDSQPRGPGSVGLDFAFPYAEVSILNLSV